MTTLTHAPRLRAPRESLVARAITRLLMRPARIAAVTPLSEHFRLIAFKGDALKACPWSPGDKIQVKLAAGLTTRTYTPMDWDKAAGATRILAYCHGPGPGGDWVRCVTPGDEHEIMGPRGSLGLRGLGPSTVLFGDETSFGLAAALRRYVPNDDLHFLFEVSNRAECSKVLDALGIQPSITFERRAGGAHLAEIADAIQRFTTDSTSFVLTGEAPSIQHINRVLKGRGITPGRLRTKAYWAPGKVGLD